MWERLIGWFHLLWDAGKKSEAHSDAIDELQDSVQRIIQALHTLATQNEFLHKDNAALRQENEALRQALQQALQHERELREAAIRELELKLRLQIAEELRRLPPNAEK